MTGTLILLIPLILLGFHYLELKEEAEHEGEDYSPADYH